MAAERTEQLALLETPVFAKGPSRAPRVRGTKPAIPASLPLRFEGPPPPASAEELRRRDAFERSQSLFRARAEPRPPPPTPTEDPLEEPVSTADSTAGEGEERVFQLPRKFTAAERNDLLKRVARVLDAVTRRAGGVDAKEQGDAVRATLDARALRVVFAGPSARRRWLPALQELARERGLVEPE
jgi:hypothetical protein